MPWLQYIQHLLGLKSKPQIKRIFFNKNVGDTVLSFHSYQGRETETSHLLSRNEMLLAARHAVLQAGENWKIEVMLKQVLCEFAFALE